MKASIFGVSLALAVLAMAQYAEATPVFTDWTSIDTSANVASGALDGTAVTMSGGDIDSGVTNYSFTGFNFPFFTPSLALSDVVYFRGAITSAYSYTITFGDVIHNPLMHIGSLASTLAFSGSPTIVKLSGQLGFTVSGSNIIGILDDSTLGSGYNDRNGTVEFLGDFTTLSFTALRNYNESVEDGIGLQIGLAAVPEPPTLALFGAGLFGLGVLRRRRKAKA
jgi:hypothetical protein